MRLLFRNRQGRFALGAAAVGCCAAWLGATSVAHTTRSARAPRHVSRMAEQVCYIYEGQYICIPDTPASDTTAIR